MDKTKYTAEFEIRASPKMLFPYLVNPAGLAQWFADNVTLDDHKNFQFVWDNRTYPAKLTAQRLNRYARFEFLADGSDDATDDRRYIEFKLDMNELTQSSFLKITDYSTDDEEDLRELWPHLVSNLREIVGG